MALSIEEFIARWFKPVSDFKGGNDIGRLQMKADLEEMMKEMAAAVQRRVMDEATKNH